MTPPRHLELIVPGLLGPTVPPMGEGLAEPTALLHLLSRADRLPSGQPQGDLERQLFSLFGLPDALVATVPAAPLQRLGDGLAVSAGGYLCADPVEMLAEQDSVYLTASDAIGLSHEEATALCTSLNRLYAEEGWQFDFADPRRLYLHLPEGSPAIVTTPTPRVMGAAIRRHLPTGPAAMVWHGVMNEMQMLCHAESFNQQREVQGACRVSGLWLWGGGTMAAIPTPEGVPWQQLSSDSPLLRGLALHSGIDHQPLPERFEQLPPAEASLLLIDSTYAAANAELGEGWRTAVERLHREWLAPAIAALGEGRLTSLTLYPLDGHRYRLTRHGLGRWWRRRRDLHHWLWGRDHG